MSPVPSCLLFFLCSSTNVRTMKFGTSTITSLILMASSVRSFSSVLARSCEYTNEPCKISYLLDSDYQSIVPDKSNHAFSLSLCLTFCSYSLPIPYVRPKTTSACVAAFQVRGGGGSGIAAPIASCLPLLAMASSSSTVVATTNPLLEQQALPKFASIQPSDLTPAVSE